VAAFLQKLPGVAAFHDLHIWGMSTTETALTVHLVRPGAAIDDDMLHYASGSCASILVSAMRRSRMRTGPARISRSLWSLSEIRHGLA
jgi:Co/Zn/Cd efflux system component